MIRSNKKHTPTLTADRVLSGTAPKRKVATREETLQARSNRASRPRATQADIEYAAIQAHIDQLKSKQAALKGRSVTKDGMQDNGNGSKEAQPQGSQADDSNVSRTPRRR